MLRKTPLASAIGSITATAVAAGAGFALPAYGEEMMEEVVVTGSRIKRADISSASPISVITQDELTVTGMTDVGQVLQSMPSMSGSPLGTSNNNGNDGQVNIDLRGLGVNRTLNLVNGHRTVDGGDYQTIPATMIERVEILKDGASAIYGADAAAGVVNIITRKDFEGVEIYTQTSDWYDISGAGQQSTGVIAGSAFDRGHFVFGAEYVDQEEAYQSDTPWDIMETDLYIYPEGCEKHPRRPYDGTPAGGCYPLGSSRIPESRIPFLTQGTFLVGTPATVPYEVGIIEAHDGRTYNYAPVNYIQTPYERTNVFAEGSFELTPDMRFSVEFRGNKRTSAQELAPLPYTDSDPQWEGNYNGQFISGISGDNYYLRRAVDAYNAANAAAITAGTVTALFYEPTNGFRRRMIESTRRFEQDVSQYQWMAKIEGELDDMSYEVYFNEGYRTQRDNDFGHFAADRLQKALGPSADFDGDGIPSCYEDIADPTTLIPGCVPLNMFGGGAVHPTTSQPVTTTITDAMLAYVAAGTLTDTQVTKQRTFGMSLAGSALELPGGPLGWAVGTSYWKQEYQYSPDSSKVRGAVTGNVGSGTDGSLTNSALYAEVLAPVWDNGEMSLQVKGGLRYDRWDAFDNDSTWQLGVEFQAMDDLKLRATAGEIYRAPTIFNLYSGLLDTFPTYSDPCIPPAGTALPPGCAQVGTQLDSQLHAQYGGTPTLQPETGDTFTAGVVWTPVFGDHSVSVTVDYWDTQIDGAITSLGAQQILEDCYISQNAAACNLITRDPTDYSIDLVIDAYLNVASQGARGIDTEVRWSYTSDLGEFEASFLWAHQLERTKKAFAGAPEEDLSGRYTNSTVEDGGAYAENKINYTVQWGWNDLTVAYKGEFISALDADTWCGCGPNSVNGIYIQDVDSILYHDLVASYNAPYGITISGAITNLTNEEPPFIETGFNAMTDPQTYRVYGRGYSLRVGWKH